jgi:LysM repeat protein
MRRDKKSDFKTSHKIILTILSFIGMLGFTFGICAFLVLGNGSKSQADMHQSDSNSEEKHLSDAKMVKLESQVTSQSPAELSQPAQVTSDEVIYTVQPGDSLERVSEQFQTSIASIMQQNDLTSPDEIYVGQVLTFLKSYVVTALPESDKADVLDVPKTSGVSVNNGNKVAAGGLSEADRTYVLSELQSRTGVDASQWDYIISRESGWIATIKNSLGYYGLFQLAPGYPGYDGDLQSQIDGAVYLYNCGGMAHWAL